MNNAFNWVEIVASDLDRAAAFYSTILDAEVRAFNFMGERQAMLPYDQGGVGGAIIARPGLEPSSQGAIAYLNARGALDEVLSRVEAAGGQVIMPKTSIGDPGSIAMIIDSEGNRIGLHEDA